MNKLLKVNLKLMVKRFDIKVCMLLFVAIGVITGINNVSIKAPSCSGIFDMVPVMCIIMSAIGGLFISRDYSNNTIRNKLVVGHTRLSLYISNQIAISLLFMLSLVVFMASAVIANIALIDSEGISTEAFTANLAVTALAVIAVSAITVFISMTVKSTMGGVLAMLFVYTLMIIGVILQAMTNSDISKLLSDIIPTLQVQGVSVSETLSNPMAKMGWSLLITAVMIGGGYAVFQKTDLK